MHELKPKYSFGILKYYINPALKVQIKNVGSALQTSNNRGLNLNAIPLKTLMNKQKNPHHKLVGICNL